MGTAKHPHDKTRPETAAVRRALEKMDVEALRLALTPRQRRFAEEYIIDLNGAAAVVRAGYSPKYPDRQAYQLMQHKGVAFLIDHLLRSREAKIVSVNPEYIVQRVLAIAEKEGSRDGGKLRAYELLARHLGMFIDRTEITGKDGGALQVEERRVEEEAESFLNNLRALQERHEKAVSDKKQLADKEEVTILD